MHCISGVGGRREWSSEVYLGVCTAGAASVGEGVLDGEGPAWEKESSRGRFAMMWVAGDAVGGVSTELFLQLLQ